MKLKFLPAAAFNNYYLWGDRQQIFCFVVFAFAAR
jgi:hypothetical protein